MSDRPRSAGDSDEIHNNLEIEISRKLGAAILDGDFMPGTRLIELDIAARFSISQGTVRAALKYLQREGLVEYRPRRGNFVTSFQESDRHELSSLRSALEGLAIGCAAQNIDDSGRQALRKTLRSMQIAARAGNHARLAELDLEFFDIIVQASGHRRLTEVHDRLRKQCRMLLKLVDDSTIMSGDVEARYAPLTDAICRGDTEQALVLAGPSPIFPRGNPVAECAFTPA
ncbi:MAG: GntR family transcriptional regulator [Phyllobacterium sp.]